MRKPDWHGASVLAWCLAMVGAIALVISPITPENILRALLVVGCARVTSAAAIFAFGGLLTSDPTRKRSLDSVEER